MFFGVEIESFALMLRPEHGKFLEKIEEAGWKHVRDGSLETDSLGSGIEVVSPKLVLGKDYGNVETVAKILQKNGNYVNKTCGLHVHIGIDEISQHIPAIVSRYRKHQKEINKFFDASRTNNRFCRTIDNAQLLFGTADKFVFSDRFYAINLHAIQKHGTIEFRQHHGTVSHDEIIMWIKFLDAFIKASSKYNVKKISSRNSPLDIRNIRPLNFMADRLDSFRYDFDGDRYFNFNLSKYHRAKIKVLYDEFCRFMKIRYNYQIDNFDKFSRYFRSYLLDFYEWMRSEHFDLEGVNDIDLFEDVPYDVREYYENVMKGE